MESVEVSAELPQSQNPQRIRNEKSAARGTECILAHKLKFDTPLFYFNFRYCVPRWVLVQRSAYATACF